MLTSITPLGERSRNSRWVITLALFAAASALSGALAGAVLGLAGSAIGPVRDSGTATRLLVLGGAAVLGLAADLGVLGSPLPGPRRQVNEHWLRAYRRWVYAVGFGAQLGLGVATVVISSGVYLWLLASLLSASPVAGAVIGGCFGLVRGASLVAAAPVKTPADLASLARRQERWDDRSWAAAAFVQGTVAAAALVAALA